MNSNDPIRLPNPLQQPETTADTYVGIDATGKI